MSFDSALLDLMGDTVLVESLASVSTDGYNRPVYSTSASTYQARHVIKQELVRTFEGTEELATSVTYVASTTTFSPHDRIKVNGAVPGPLMSVQTYPDESGTHHSKLAWG